MKGVTTATKYVASVVTTGNGLITVTAQNIDAAGKGLSIDPELQGNSGSGLTTAAIPTQIHQFKCMTAATNAMPARHLPGSCEQRDR